MRELIWVILLALAIYRMASHFDREEDGKDVSRRIASTSAARRDGAAAVIRGGELPLLSPSPLWAGGHFLFIHQRDHGTSSVLSKVKEYVDTHHVPVDCVILDAFWWHPADMFRFHPQIYPEPHALISALHNQSIRIVLWMSALVPSADATQTSTLRKRHFGMYEDKAVGPLVFHYHHHHYSPALRGSLVDLTNPEAASWFMESFHRFVSTYAIDGVRCGGVDTLLAKLRHVKGIGGHVSAREYSDAYYRWFHDAGRKGRGFEFLVVSRPVDTFENLVYHRFAPQDVTFAGWVGDHRFSFPGLKDTAMNLLHSSQACYVSFGCFVGGTLLDDVGRLPDAHQAVLEQGAALLERGVGGSVALEGAANRRYMRLESTPPTHLADQRNTSSSSSSSTAVSHMEGLMNKRRRELLLRWAEMSAFLPFFATGASHLHHPWSFGAAAEYAQLVKLHRSLSLFHASNAAAALLSADELHMTPGRHHTAEEQAAMRRGCPIRSLSRRPVHYEFPALGDWGLVLGDSVAVFPVVDSFGEALGAGSGFAASVGQALLAYRSVSTGGRCVEWVCWWAPDIVLNSCEGTPAASSILTKVQGMTRRIGLPPAFQRADTLVPLIFHSHSSMPPHRKQAHPIGEATLIVFRSVQLLATAPPSTARYTTPHVPKPYLPAVRAEVNVSGGCSSASTAALFCVTFELPSVDESSAHLVVSPHDAEDVDQQHHRELLADGGGDVEHSQLPLYLGVQMHLRGTPQADDGSQDAKRSYSCSCSGSEGYSTRSCLAAVPRGARGGGGDVVDDGHLFWDMIDGGIQDGRRDGCFYRVIGGGERGGRGTGTFVVFVLSARSLLVEHQGTPSVQCTCR